MQPRSNASIGAWALRTPDSERAADARTSFELVGSSTIATDAVLRPTNPIEAARAWLADPGRRAALAPSLVARAEASVLVAERWFTEIDRLANELVDGALADESGEIDATALERIEAMIGVLTTYSTRMRELLDPVAPASDADERISAALTASRAGGLPAFVDAL